METKKKQIGCVIMASGFGRRFGSNKVLAEFRGKTLLEWILEKTKGNLFEKRVVVTRYPEVVRICQDADVEVILHDLPYRSDTVRLGLQAMPPEIEGCMFCPIDQPVLSRESLKKMIYDLQGKDGICRLGYGEKSGAPVLFGSRYFEELLHLPEGKGGNVLIQKYGDKVVQTEGTCEEELMDADTPQILAWLEKRI